MTNFDDEDMRVAITLLAIAFMISAFASFHLGWYFGSNKTKIEAVKNNAAEYVADKNGYATLKWKGQDD